MTRSQVERRWRIGRRTLEIGLPVILLVSLACGRGNEQPAGAGSGSARKVAVDTGPIAGVATAASLDDHGRIVEQASSFKPTAPQITVVAHVRKVVGTLPLTIAWYSVSDKGDQKLFEHTIQVASFDRAFSVGRNPGLLALGKYKAVATLGGASKTVTWTVAEKQTKPGAEQSANTNAAQFQQPLPPASGASGTVSVAQMAAGTAPPGCRAHTSILGMTGKVYFDGLVFDEKSARPDLAKCASIADLPGDLEVLISIEDKETMVACSFSAAETECEGGIDPCEMPGGSDLPRTKVRSILRQKSTNKQLDKDSDDFDEDVNGPRVQLVSDPSNGATMKRGKKIKLTGIAEEIDKDGWHDGVNLIQIVKTPDREVITDEPFPRRKACDKKSLKRTMEEFLYTIPDNAPAALKFCAEADDWAGNHGEADCVNILISPKLKGRFRHKTVYRAKTTTGTHEVEGDLSLTVKADGSITGTARLKLTFLQITVPGEGYCGATETIEPIEVELPVIGSLTENGIVVQWTSAAIPRQVTFKSNCAPVQKGMGSFSAAFQLMPWPVDWDGKAYTNDEEEAKDSGPGWSRVQNWNIRLEPVDDAGVS